MKNNKIVQAFEGKKPTPKINKEQLKQAYQDIIITKHEKIVTYNDNGDMVIKRMPVKVNITRKVNETARLIKEQTAEQKLAELEKIFTK